MQQCDAALKSVLTRGTASFLSELIGVQVARFVSGEFRDARTLHADLLGEATDGSLFHVELQSTNDAGMAWRMLEYFMAIRTERGFEPRQTVLYVGEAPMRMQNRIAGQALAFQFQLVDLRELDGERLLASDSLEENIVGVLARVADSKRAVRRVLEKITAGKPEVRAKAVKELTLLAGLRSLGSYVIEESKRMPITTDIMEHDYFGPLIRNGIAQGRVEGRLEGERALLVKILAKRFGALPAWASERIGLLDAEELEDLGVRFVEARSLEELFGEG